MLLYSISSWGMKNFIIPSESKIIELLVEIGIENFSKVVFGRIPSGNPLPNKYLAWLLLSNNIDESVRNRKANWGTW